MDDFEPVDVANMQYKNRKLEDLKVAASYGKGRGRRQQRRWQVFFPNVQILPSLEIT